MPVEERRRRALREHIPAAWGEEAADTLFELITPAGHEPATRQDLERGFGGVDQRFAELEGHVDQRFVEFEARVDQRFAEFEARVDHRFAESEARVDHRFAEFEARLGERFAEFGQHFEQRIADAVTTQTRTLVLSQLAALVAIAALAFGLR